MILEAKFGDDPDFQDRSIMLEGIIILLWESVVFGARDTTAPPGSCEELNILKLGHMFETVKLLFSDNAEAWILRRISAVFSIGFLSSVIRQKGESQNGCFKKTKHSKFSEMFVFRKIWRALFSWNIRFEIRPFALLPTLCDLSFLDSFREGNT